MSIDRVVLAFAGVAALAAATAAALLHADGGTKLLAQR